MLALVEKPSVGVSDHFDRKELTTMPLVTVFRGLAWLLCAGVCVCCALFWLLGDRRKALCGYCENQGQVELAVP